MKGELIPQVKQGILLPVQGDSIAKVKVQITAS